MRILSQNPKEKFSIEGWYKLHAPNVFILYPICNTIRFNWCAPIIAFNCFQKCVTQSLGNICVVGLRLSSKIEFTTIMASFQENGKRKRGKTSCEVPFPLNKLTVVSYRNQVGLALRRDWSLLFEIINGTVSLDLYCTYIFSLN